MRTKKHFFLLAVVAGILCVPALGEVEVFPPDDHGLIAQPNPTLAAIEKLYLAIVPPDAEPDKNGLVWGELEEKIKGKLKEAGIKIVPGIAAYTFAIPMLRINIDMLKLKDSQQFIFRIQTSLSREVLLARKSDFSFKADVWKAEPVMQAVSVQNMPDKVADVVLEQVEGFIHAYLVANSPGKKTDVKTNDTVSLTTRKEQVKPITKSTVAEYKYVASKNSKVFHKPQCSSAKRIKPKNIIGYNSRDETIKAGKRPCKRCEP